jgi:hypothetical protein
MRIKSRTIEYTIGVSEHSRLSGSIIPHLVLKDSSGGGEGEK